jgi:predicted AlkP superfamily phosphohydrolase/phosphomutase
MYGIVVVFCEASKGPGRDMSQSETGTRSNQRLMMLGLDSISLPFIQENLRTLPVLASLLKRGVLRPLSTPATHLSAAVWPTFLSGKQPGEHGQYFPFQWSAEHRQFRRIAGAQWSEEFADPPFWHDIAESGVLTIAFDIGHALCDEGAPCLQITNWSYQSSGAAKASDPQVLKELRKRFGRRPIGHEVPIPKTARQCAGIRRQQIAAVKAKADATLYLMRKPWRLFVSGWYEVHRAGHNLWPSDGDFASDASPDAMLAVYQETDRQVGRICAALDRDETETSLLLFSLHGMEPNRAQDHFLPEILSRLNLIYLGEQLNRSERPSTLNAMALLRRALPATLQYRTASLLGEAVQDWVVNRALTAGREWDRTPSFSLISGGEGLIRINVKGRESPGFFDPESAELAAYVSWLGERLAAIEVCETGEPLIEEIVNVDAVFPGARRRFLPDMILRWAPKAPVHRIRSPEIGVIEVSLATGRGGNHNDRAFMIASGGDAFLQAVAPIHDVADLGKAAEALLLTCPRHGRDHFAAEHQRRVRTPEFSAGGLPNSE